jgi:uncharacterized membrane protein YhaH (DUF805 family)
MSVFIEVTSNDGRINRWKYWIKIIFPSLEAANSSGSTITLEIKLNTETRTPIRKQANKHYFSTITVALSKHVQAFMRHNNRILV